MSDQPAMMEEMSTGLNRVSVVGHTGFIGGYIYRRMLDILPGVEIMGVSRRQVDLSAHGAVERLADYFSPDMSVVFCAGVKRQTGDSMVAFQQNMQIVENLCITLERNPVRQLVYISSAAVYGEDVHNTGITEDTAIDARTFYGIAKYASERLLCKVLSPNWPGVLTILRPPLVYGHGYRSLGYGPSRFLHDIGRSDEIALWGDGSELREFLYVEDLAKIVCLSVVRRVAGVFNPVSGKSYPFTVVLDGLVRATGRQPAVRIRDRTKSKVDNIYRAKAFSDAFPDFNFTELSVGLRAMVQASGDHET